MKIYKFLFLQCIIWAGCKKSDVKTKKTSDSTANITTKPDTGVNSKPDTGWYAIAPLPAPRAYATGFSLNNLGYVGGGSPSLSDPTAMGYNDMYMYDPAQNTWTKKAWLPYLVSSKLGRVYPFSFVINNVVYAGGGLPNGGGGGRDVEQYDPVKDTWTLLAQLGSTAEFDYSVAASYENKGYIFSYNTTNKAVWIFDPSVNKITEAGFTSRLTFIQLDAWLGTNSDQLLYGSEGSYAAFAYINTVNNTETFYPSNGYYAALPNTPVVTKNAVFYNNSIYVSFGDAGHLYRYNFKSNVWQIITTKTLGVTNAVANFLVGSKLYIVGGNNGLSSPSTSQAWAIDLSAYP